MDKLEGVRGVVVWSNTGGPIREILTGRKDIPSGNFTGVKSGSLPMPWEGWTESDFLKIAEVGSQVVRFCTQPCRVELMARGRNRPRIYFPDCLLKVHPELFDALHQGKAFAESAFLPIKRFLPEAHAKSLIVEIKADNDPRDKDQEYQEKLMSAQELFQEAGIPFLILRGRRHVAQNHLRTARLILPDRRAILEPVDETRLFRLFERRRSVTYGELRSVLAKAQIHHLHVHRAISIDLRNGLHDDAQISWVEKD